MVKLKKPMHHIRRGVARVRGIGFILFHARHEFYHALLGVVWVFILREIWGEFQMKWIYLSIFFSLLPDMEHMLYFFSYGKADPYTRQIKQYMKNGHWRMVTVYIENGHKHQTDLSYHNFYVIAFLLVATSLAFFFDKQSWTVVFGAMVIHYLFDVVDDFMMLGKLNPNWKRWGNGKKNR